MFVGKSRLFERVYGYNDLPPTQRRTKEFVTEDMFLGRFLQLTVHSALELT